MPEHNLYGFSGAVVVTSTFHTYKGSRHLSFGHAMKSPRLTLLHYSFAFL